MTSDTASRGPGGAGSEDELSLLLSVATKFLARSGDPTLFLDWIAEAGPDLARRTAAREANDLASAVGGRWNEIQRNIIAQLMGL